MDKDKSSDAGSWMDLHHFIGDLLTSGHTSKTHPDVLGAVWGVAAGVGFKPKPASLELPPLPPPHNPPPHPPHPPPPQQQQHPEVLQATAGRGTREDVPHTCTCPGCPYSTASTSSKNLTSKRSLASAPEPDPLCHPKDLSISSCSPDPIVGSSTSQLENRSSGGSEMDSERRTHRQDSNLVPGPSEASSTSMTNLLFPCLCCCSSLHPNHRAPDHSHSLSHSHAHQHFHHHRPLMSCLPPTPQVSGSYSCCCFTCNQVCHHQHRQEKDRTLTDSVSVYPCMHCSTSFCRPTQLLQHQRSEHANKPPGFICTECGRTFNSHSNLRIHLHVHTGARPYSCSDCGKRFSQSGALKIHRRIHTGERPYTCNFCGRGFPHLAGVQAHHRTHTGEKPYSCGQCGKSFSQSGALKNHTRIHTGERPFVCSLCGKGFSNHSGIRSHYRTNHAMSPKQFKEVANQPAVRNCSPGRPKTSSSSSIRTITPEKPFYTPQKPVNTSIPMRESEHKSQAEGEKMGFQRQGLLYECEDCGQRFKDAPSRNRHQTLVHYSQDKEKGQESDPHCEGSA
ncbi:zinc finger protein 239 isoform X2 [Gouania willdenowi]|uniref:Zinc finger protein 239-like n=1 Tax=Gouania willdenowi TaxID=441366 RepID=A0A8C5DWL8_GOUWI|nr:zinc finger protein 239-like isoform X2 [Gouania willdenowi]